MFLNQSRLDAIFAHIFREFLQIFRDFAKVFTDFAQTFPRIFRFSGILPGFSPHQNFWGCTYTPGSYTTDIVKQTVIARSKSINLN